MMLRAQQWHGQRRCAASHIHARTSMRATYSSGRASSQRPICIYRRHQMGAPRASHGEARELFEEAPLPVLDARNYFWGRPWEALSCLLRPNRANLGRRQRGGHFSWDNIYWAGHLKCLTMENDNYRQCRLYILRPESATSPSVTTWRR